MTAVSIGIGATGAVVRTLPAPDEPDTAAAAYDSLYAVCTEVYRKTAQDMRRLSAHATQ